jgi:hypothetical protein
MYDTSAALNTKFTAADIARAIAYRDSSGFAIYKISAEGRITFDILNMHVRDLNKILSRPVNYAEELAALRAKMRAALKGSKR